jgi:hypothetical protein
VPSAGHLRRRFANFQRQVHGAVQLILETMGSARTHPVATTPIHTPRGRGNTGVWAWGRATM